MASTSNLSSPAPALSALFLGRNHEGPRHHGIIRELGTVRNSVPSCGIQQPFEDGVGIPHSLLACLAVATCRHERLYICMVHNVYIYIHIGKICICFLVRVSWCQFPARMWIPCCVGSTGQIGSSDNLAAELIGFVIFSVDAPWACFPQHLDPLHYIIP